MFVTQAVTGFHFVSPKWTKTRRLIFLNVWIVNYQTDFAIFKNIGDILLSCIASSLLYDLPSKYLFKTRRFFILI